MRNAMLAVLVVVSVVSGCGLRTQTTPEPVALTPGFQHDTTTPADPTAGNVEVFFVRGNRLEPVTRAVASPSPGSVLQALGAGPTRAEVLVGIRTAMPPQPFRVALSDTATNVAVVQVGPGFASIAGENQLLAVAQVVWTVTEMPGIRRARLQLAGETLEVPTDRGLVGYPVGRDEFTSVAPLGSGNPSAGDAQDG